LRGAGGVDFIRPVVADAEEVEAAGREFDDAGAIVEELYVGVCEKAFDGLVAGVTAAISGPGAAVVVAEDGEGGLRAAEAAQKLRVAGDVGFETLSYIIAGEAD
jgi:hypothetical protein